MGVAVGVAVGPTGVGVDVRVGVLVAPTTGVAVRVGVLVAPITGVGVAVAVAVPPHTTPLMEKLAGIPLVPIQALVKPTPPTVAPTAMVEFQG
jgi:hypothetical protein